MDLLLNVTLTSILIILLVTMCCSIGWLLVRGNHSRLTHSFIGCQISIVFWLISQLLILFSVNNLQYSISYAVGNFGICFIGTFWLMFSLNYIDKKLSKIQEISLIGISVIFFLISVTNPMHNMYYAEFSVSGVKYAPFFYLSQLYIYVCIIFGMAMVCRQCFVNKQHSKGEASLLIFAPTVPLVINLLTITDIIHFKFSLIPLAFAFSSITLLFATYRYGFLNVNNIAFEDAFNSMKEGIIVFNRRGNVTYLSKSANKLLKIKDYRTFSAVIKYLSSFSNSDISDEFEDTEVKLDGKSLSLKCYNCNDEKGQLIAKIIIVSDITRYYQLIDKTNELASAQQCLAIEQERNRIAQEVHDTAGHTFTMISSLAKLSQAELSDSLEKADISKIRNYISETETLARGGITQLRCSINNLRNGNFLNSITTAVKTLTDAVRDMEVEICVQGKEDEKYDFCIKSVYDSCRETITNCMRYSNASRIDIILKFLEESFELYIFDNGKGCNEISRHNGLNGIIRRTEELHGTANFNSSEGNGFTTIIKIPIKNMK